MILLLVVAQHCKYLPPAGAAWSDCAVSWLQVCIWRWPGLSKLATLTGHSMRVLYLAVSPDGQTIVTGAGAPRTP